ncbi:hypothetical protein KY290_003185 [Solanum tuberosum]|uniref:Uncharacterized protein n=1 Tax=Solanum tuberosum TaxID=4113 RepID=A0ABQ7WUD9_SOLTU|nr:hypothetical protein KY284_003328 [Solanum tuberosum]KAH0767289.1 hypothetical protein KY285_003160 [Solanum tuberosum]KAH0783587.1 hypothetical protein KY290_003185 [Solanum tuberosum]
MTVCKFIEKLHLIDLLPMVLTTQVDQLFPCYQLTSHLTKYDIDCQEHLFRIIQDVEAISLATNEHPVALLAEHTKKLLQRDNTIYMRILSQRPNAAAVSASILHKLYGIKLAITALNRCYLATRLFAHSYIFKLSS